MAHANSRNAIAAAFLALAITTRLAHAAWPHDPLLNMPIASNPAAQNPRCIVPDGAGGDFIVWEDFRNLADYDIYAQHLTASGAVAPGWPTTGLAICTASGTQDAPTAVSDGAGGAIISWTDRRAGSNGDIFAMRVNGNGTFPAGWPANGRQLLADTHDEFGPVIVSDGAGGAELAWSYTFGVGDIDIYGARVNASGTVLWAHSLWSPGALQVFPTAVGDGSGGFVVGFQDNFSGNYDIRAVRYNGAGGLVWGAVDVCIAAFDQDSQVATSDGAGGIVLAWRDTRAGQHDIYAQRITAAGAVAPGWPINGSPVCTEPDAQEAPQIASDGAGGAIITWFDYRNPAPDIYAQRMLAGGAPAFGWYADGNPISAASGNQTFPYLVADGAGGAIVVWTDFRSGVGLDVFASCVTADGQVAPGWLYDGTPLTLAGNDQSFPVIAPDGSGGAIVAWRDYRNGTIQAYAQTVDGFGQLGDARPGIASIKDVKADQGGHVRLVWNTSYLDAKPRYAIASYWIWRQTPAGVAAAAVKDGGAWVDGPGGVPSLAMTAGGDGPPRRLFRHAQDATAGFAWEYLASQPTNGSPQYSYVAPTASDSLPGYNPYTVFMVEARGVATGTFWDSPADSGYSVDNLPPLAPAPFTGAYTAGATHLHWGANLEADLANYRLYRGSTAGFVPGISNRIASPPDTGFADVGSAGSYYKLSAVDIHGNESAFALLSPSGTADAKDGPPLELALARPAPNPAREPLHIVCTLPHEMRVRLAIYDVTGRVTRVLADGVLPAGEQARTWDLRDQAGSVAQPGLYFVRMEAEGRRFDERLVVIGSR